MMGEGEVMSQQMAEAGELQRQLHHWEISGRELEEKILHNKIVQKAILSCLRWPIDVTHTIHNKHATLNSIELLDAFFAGRGGIKESRK